MWNASLVSGCHPAGHGAQQPPACWVSLAGLGGGISECLPRGSHSVSPQSRRMGASSPQWTTTTRSRGRTMRIVSRTLARPHLPSASGPPGPTLPALLPPRRGLGPLRARPPSQLSTSGARSSPDRPPAGGGPRGPGPSTLRRRPSPLGGGLMLQRREKRGLVGWGKRGCGTPGVGWGQGGVWAHTCLPPHQSCL